MPPLSALGVSGDPTYTHSRQFFGNTRSPSAVYSGSCRRVVCALLLVSHWASTAVTVKAPTTDAVNTGNLMRILVLHNVAPSILAGVDIESSDRSVKPSSWRKVRIFADY